MGAPDNLTALQLFRFIHISFCGNCICYAEPTCFRTLQRVKPWDRCGEFVEVSEK